MPLRIRPPSRASRRMPATSARVGRRDAVAPFRCAAAAAAGRPPRRLAAKTSACRRHAAGADLELDRRAGLDRRQALPVVAGLVAQVQRQPHRAGGGVGRHRAAARRSARAALRERRARPRRRRTCSGSARGSRPRRSASLAAARRVRVGRNQVVVGRNVRLQVPAGGDLEPGRQLRPARPGGRRCDRRRRSSDDLLEPDGRVCRRRAVPAAGAGAQAGPRARDVPACASQPTAARFRSTGPAVGLQARSRRAARR